MMKKRFHRWIEDQTIKILNTNKYHIRQRYLVTNIVSHIKVDHNIILFEKSLVIDSSAVSEPVDQKPPRSREFEIVRLNIN